VSFCFNYFDVLSGIPLQLQSSYELRKTELQGLKELTSLNCDAEETSNHIDRDGSRISALGAQ
jgi:hypothetical protein